MTEPDVNRDETHHCQAMRERDSLARRLSVLVGELEEARAALRQMTNAYDDADVGDPLANDIGATARCPNCAPGYDCSRGIYAPPDRTTQDAEETT